MAKAKRVNMSFQPGEWRPVKELLARVAAFKGEAGAAKLILMELAKNKELEAAVVTCCYEALRGVTRRNMSSPYPAHARTDTQVVVDLKSTTNGRIEEIAKLLTELDWRDAVLPKRLSPMTYAAQLVEMFPDKNLVQDIQLAQIWHLDRKPSWKRLAHSLNSWLAKPPPPWAKKRGQRSMFGPTPQSEQQDYSKGVNEDGSW